MQSLHVNGYDMAYLEVGEGGSAWAEHAEIAKHIFAGDAKAAERAALAHAQTAGRMTEERLRATDEVAG